jgi:myo-inositol-1(or 4)-monophosphatase
MKNRCQQIQKILLSARPLLLEGFNWSPSTKQNTLQTKTKSSFRDLVTIYDKKVEEFLTQEIQKKFPGELIIGEESCADPKEGLRHLCQQHNAFWILDPIDGTTNFSRSYPFFCSTISFVENENGKLKPKIGVTYNPVSGEMFWAVAGQGAWIGREQIRVSPVDSAETALLTTGFASLRSTEDHRSFKIFQELTQQTLGVRRDGSAALDLAYVAAGRIDGYWEWGLSAWDIAAGVLLVQEAGGTVTHHDGEELDLIRGEILSSNSRLHKWLINKIKQH